MRERGGGGGGERERERQTDRVSKIETGRQKNIQTGRQRETGRQTKHVSMWVKEEGGGAGLEGKGQSKCMMIR